MPKYITCITRVLLNARRILMSSCPGEPALYDTHCQYCGYWVENQTEPEGEDDADFSRENLSERSEDGYISEDDEDEEEVK